MKSLGVDRHHIGSLLLRTLSIIEHFDTLIGARYINGWLCGVVVGRRTCDREVASSTPGRYIAG